MKTDRLPIRQELSFATIEYEIIDDERIGKEHLTVYLALVYHANREGEKAFPSFATIAKIARCSRSKAITCINDMIKFGYVEKTARMDAAGDRTSNGYFLPSMHRRYIAMKARKRGGAQDGLPPSVPKTTGSPHGGRYLDPPYPNPTNNGTGEPSPASSGQPVAASPPGQEVME